MSISKLFSAALLGLAISFSAHAQTPVPGTPGVATTPGTPNAAPTTGSVVSPANTGSLPTGTVPQGAVPTGTYPGGLPARNVDGGTLRADRPVGTNPAVTGSQQTRSLNRKRTGLK